MEFGSPVRENTTTFIVPVETTRLLTIDYLSNISGSYTTPPLDRIEMKQYLSEIAVLYEPYSSKWFNKNTPVFFFLQNLSHRWNHSKMEPYRAESRNVGAQITVTQTWRPESITIQPKLFQISWILETSNHSSYSITKTSPGIKSEEIPYGDNQTPFILSDTPRSILHRKIRRAKLIAQIADLRVKKLYLKYYKRYGDFNTNERDSPLSSDSEL